MELGLVRTYFPSGTNGDILDNGKRICSAIELPWIANKQDISCIPEGRYELTKGYNATLQHHICVNDVKGRSEILIHAFSNALCESDGCIAPVLSCTAEGKGVNSKLALKRVVAIVYTEIDKGKRVFITIKSISNE